VNGFEETENLKRGKVGGVKPIDRTERHEIPKDAAGNGERRTGGAGPTKALVSSRTKPLNGT
jgi:hypothetical protein